MNSRALIDWAWGILRDAIEGFAHGAIIGSAVGPMATGTLATLSHSALVGGFTGAGKQALLYMNSNPLPPLLKPAPAAPGAPAA